MKKIKKDLIIKMLLALVIITAFLTTGITHLYSSSNENLRLQIGSHSTYRRLMQIIKAATGKRFPVEVSLAGGTKKVDLQIPPALDLSAKVTSVTFILDIDKTLTASGRDDIDPQNLEQIIRALRLMKHNSNMRIKIILISGSAYKRYAETRFGPLISEWKGIQPDIMKEIVAELKREGKGPEQVRAIPLIWESIKWRVIEKIKKRAEEGGLIDYLSNIEIRSVSGSEVITFEKEAGEFLYHKETERVFSEQEQLEIAKALGITYLEALGEKIGVDFRGAINSIENAASFLGENGVNAIFAGATSAKGVDVQYWPFDSETAIFFPDERGVNGHVVALTAMERLKKKGILREDVQCFATGGSNFTKISLFDKAGEIRSVKIEGIVIGGGDSLTDNFLWNSGVEKGVLIYFGKREEVAEYNNVIVALDENGKDLVRHRGPSVLLSHVLDVMENGGTWGEVKFLNNQFSPIEVILAMTQESLENIMVPTETSTSL